MIKMSDELIICKRCGHLKGNHVSYEGDNKCTKCNCHQFLE